jgi:hypothetical protein
LMQSNLFFLLLLVLLISYPWNHFQMFTFFLIWPYMYVFKWSKQFYRAKQILLIHIENKLFTFI